MDFRKYSYNYTEDDEPKKTTKKVEPSRDSKMKSVVDDWNEFVTPDGFFDNSSEERIQITNFKRTTPQEYSYYMDTDDDSEDAISAEQAAKKRKVERIKKRRMEEKKRHERRIIIFASFAFLVLCFVIFVIATLARSGDNIANTDSSSENCNSSECISSSDESTNDSNEMTEESTEPTSTAAYVYRDAVQGASMNPQGSYYMPSWITQDLLTISQYNRPGQALSPVKNVVIHYVGNPGSSAKDNRDYFQDLGNPSVNTTGHGASSHFIVGLKGEVVQCVPVHEVAFANYPRNYDTVSIEVCHPDAQGKFTDTTYWQVVKLASFLCQQFGLTANDVIRHNDVSGKNCPLYYVEHPDAWKQMREDICNYMIEHPDIQSEFP